MVSESFLFCSCLSFLSLLCFCDFVYGSKHLSCCSAGHEITDCALITIIPSLWQGESGHDDFISEEKPGSISSDTISG